MKRRTFIAGLAGVAALRPSPGRAQRPQRNVPHVGVIWLWTATAAITVRVREARVRGPRWEHEHLLDAFDANPQALRLRRETVEHSFGTMKARMGATHFLTKTLPKVASEIALSVLAYNLTRVMNIVGTKPLKAAIAARDCTDPGLS